MSKSLKEIFNVTEAYKLPDAIMESLFSDNALDMLQEVKENVDCDIRDFFQEDQGDRKGLKQDFTPQCICDLVSKLVKNGNCLDMCSGTGVLGKSVATKNGVSVEELEFSERTIPFALLDSCLNGLEGRISRFDCLTEEMFASYELTKQGAFSVPVEAPFVQVGKYNNVVMNPPYSLKTPGKLTIDGMPIPSSKADYGFILRGLKHLKEGGRLIAILPHGVLFRGSAEQKIRQHLIDQKLISAVIGLPDKLFMNTSIPVCVLVLERNSENILFVDASKDFVKNSKQNNMTENQIDRIVSVFENRKEETRFSHVATYEEISQNDSNLNIPRYVDTYIPEPIPELSDILDSLSELQEEEKEVCAELAAMTRQLIGDEKNISRLIQFFESNEC